MNFRDWHKVIRARRAGARHALKIMQEARRADISPDLAYALVEQESAFQNAWGHDPVKPPQQYGGKVTRTNYARYKRLRKAGYGMQGCGLTQLTYYTLQDEADRLGGCWKPRHQLRVGFGVLKDNIKRLGYRKGIRSYNGTGPAAERYADLLIARRERWHRVLHP